jgi:RNA methyltransferase, TrmH family
VQDTVTITRNELKHVKSLLTRKGRVHHGQFTAEGVRLLEEALRHDVFPCVVYVARSALSDRGEQLVARMENCGVRTAAVRQRELEQMADTDSPQGLVALFDRPAVSLTQLSSDSLRKIVWCPDIADPGNLGTIVRTALAFDFNLVIVGENAVDPWSPKVVRSSAGAVLALPVVTAGVPETLRLAEAAAVRLVVADSHGTDDPTSLDRLDGDRVMLVLGSEAHGVAPEAIRAGSLRVRIPHTDKLDSLNVAVAGAILMQRLYRQVIGA